VRDAAAGSTCCHANVDEALLSERLFWRSWQIDTPTQLLHAYDVLGSITLGERQRDILLSSNDGVYRQAHALHATFDEQVTQLQSDCCAGLHR
jgi:hypothetical protein